MWQEWVKEEVPRGFLAGKLGGKKPLGKYRHRWEDNIKLDLQKWSAEGMDWIDLAQERDRFYKTRGNLLTSWRSVCFSGSTVDGFRYHSGY
jgi:hypothetical protein